MAREDQELIKMGSICRNPKEQLLEYVKKNETENICTLLAKEGTNLLIEKYDYPYLKPILYIACEDLANHVLASTVETLIVLGADPHYIDEDTGYKEAIHFAVNGMNPDILRVIIDNMTKEDGINATTYGNTALHLLVNSDETNTGKYEKCLDILLKSGINVNKTNKKRHTAIVLAAAKGYRNVVTAILNCGKYVDIDNSKYDKKSARDYILQNKLYDEPLPLNIYDPNENNVDSPVTFIQEKRVEDFLKLKDVNVNYEIEEGTLLQLACERNLIPIVQFLLENGANVNKVTRKNEHIPLKIVAEKGYHKLFKLLLNKYIPLPEGILILLLSSMIPSKDEDVNYEECVRYLLKEKQGKISVNDCSVNNNTPLHYASGLSDTDLTLKLLEQGASLANKNKFNCLPVEEISPQTLEQHFNNCVDIKEQSRNDKQSIIVTFDYTSLIPTIEKQRKCDKDRDVECEGMLFDERYNNTVSETGVIHVMSKVPEMRKLLIHPLISSFIFIKWYRMRWFFWANLLLFAIFCASLIAYVFRPDHNGNDDQQEESKTTTIVVWSILLLTYILLILREIFQMILSIATYFCSWSNILETFMLGICYYVIFYKSTELLYKQLSSIAMILVALEVMVLLGQHPSLSTNIVMLRTVTKNFFFFLCWYAVLILAFVLCFYKLFNTDDDKSNTVNKSNCTDSDNEEKEQDFYKEPSLTFIKTIVMLTGEFDASSINFDSFLNRLIFLLFVFMVSIILFNLLNGLAVSDTQTIQSEAEIMGYIERINYVVYFENVILGNALSTNISCLFEKYFGCCPIRKTSLMPKCLIEQISLVPNYISKCKMEMLLYRGGRIIRGENKGSANCFRYCKDIHIDRKTIQRVKDLLHDKQNKFKEMQQIKDLQDIIKCQREIIDNLRAARNSS